MNAVVGISAIVTAHRRIEPLLVTLSTLLACRPPPDEVLVHIDGENAACEAAVRERFPEIHILKSTSVIGPGGGRNLLIAAASCPIVASFDDDSYPMDADYFGRLAALFSAFPSAAVVTARIFHVNDVVEPPRTVAEWGADFSGGACAYRRQRYLGVGGYVPLPDAYNMEEVDFALRLHGQGGKVLGTPWLRVFHDTDLARHADPVVTSASISNLALLTFLRYPMSLWPVGVGQVLNRISWLVRHGRRRGVAHGLASIPQRLWAYRAYRQPVSPTVLRSYLALRRQPVTAEFAP